MPDFGKLQKLPAFCKASIGQETNSYFSSHWAAKERIISIKVCNVHHRNMKVIAISNHFFKD
jgi:hypothetical protein